MEPLLQPIRIGDCLLKNRIVMTAASLCRCKGGFVTEALLDFYATRAKGGAGLLVAGGAGVDPAFHDGTALQVWDDRFLPGLTSLTETIHREGGKVFLQLLHPGALAGPQLCRGKPPVAPSVYRSKLTNLETRALSREEIQDIAAQFAQGAARAKQAGFDGVELCGSAGYLIASFLSAATNRREDSYGGGLPQRARFLLEIIDAVQRAAGRDFPLMVRLSGEDQVVGGNTVEETAELAALLEKAGVHGISVTTGWHEAAAPQITGHVPRGAFRQQANRVRSRLHIPVVCCGRMDLETGRSALLERDCDLVGLCRPLIADPFLVRKLEQHRTAEIFPCLSCNQECLDAVLEGRPVGCAIRPQIGAEQRPLHCASENQRILVAGAGISGMVFAAGAAAANRVTVMDRAPLHGGRARLLAAASPWRDCKAYLDALYQACLEQGVRFRFRRPVTEADVRQWLSENTFDKIVWAAGAGERPLRHSVASEMQIYTMAQCWEQGFPLSRHTVILGNDFRALQFAVACAERLPAGRDCTVTCVGPMQKPGGGMARSVRWAAVQDARAKGVRLIDGAAVLQVAPSRVTYLQNETVRQIPAGTVIRTGLKPNPFPVENLPEPLRHKVVTIGDASLPGKITQAVRSALEAATGRPAQEEQT